MSGDAESVTAAISQSAAEYQKASWDAYDRQAAPPDPAALTDHALHGFLRYEAPNLLLPSGALEAVEEESKRRGSPDFIDELTAASVLALLGVGGVVIGWALLVP